MPLVPAHEPCDAVADLLRVRSPFPGASPSDRDVAAMSGTEPSRPAKPAAEILAGRRSVRSFADQPLHTDHLADVLRRAEQQQRAQWPVEAHGSPSMTMLVAARTLTGLEPGLYRRDPAASCLTALDATVPVGLTDGLHAAYTTAPALVLICGPVRSMPGAVYGNLLVRAGALGYAIWLAALTTGLCCSVYGGTSESISRLSGRARAHLFTLAIGHPDGTEPR